MMLHNCTGCREDLPAERFSPDRRRPAGLQSRCKTCKATAQAKLRASDVDRDREIVRRSYRKHAVKRRADARAQYHRDPERAKARNRKWAKNNPERARANARRFRRELQTDEAKARQKAQIRQWTKNNPEKDAARQARRYNARRGAEVSDLTVEQWQAIIAVWGFACAYCETTDVRLTQDHVVPISRGGNHTAENVVPACRSCNSAKHAKTPAEWRRSEVS